MYNKQIFYKILQQGDLLFQITNSEISDAIVEVNKSYKNIPISHVAMVITSHNKTVKLIEAFGESVNIIDLNQFLNRTSNFNMGGRIGARVLIGRLQKKYIDLIPNAIENSISWIGLPYNFSFNSDNKFQQFYCSQLIYDAFLLSNNKNPIFGMNYMTFKQNGVFCLKWINYFNNLKINIPEGSLGTNPGLLSLSSSLEIIYSC